MSAFRLTVLTATAAAIIGLFVAWHMYTDTDDLGAHIDPDQVRTEFVATTLDPWLKASTTTNGLFQPHLSRKWQPAANQKITVAAQARLLYVFASGYEVTKDQRFRKAVVAGADYMLAHFANPAGGWYQSLDANGDVIEPVADYDGSAAAILGLTSAYHITKDKRYLDAALATWKDDGSKIMFDARLGPLGPKPPAPVDGVVLTQLPLMDLFEGLLYLYQETRSTEVWQDIESLARFVFKDLYHRKGTYIPERYDSNWHPIIDTDAGNINIAHQFKWAYLISRAVEMGLAKSYLTPGHELITLGLKMGYDKENGGIFTTAKATTGEITDRTKTFAGQCELLRTLAHYATLRDQKQLWPDFDKTWQLIHTRFEDKAYGGWFMTAIPGTQQDKATGDKGNLSHVGYHQTGLYTELIRLSQIEK